MAVFPILPSHQKRAPYYLKITGEDCIPVKESFSLTVKIYPCYNDKGYLLSLELHHLTGIIYRHSFACESIPKEGSPCGGIFNEQIALSEIAQAYIKFGKRTPSPPLNLLHALESGVCVYKGFKSCKAWKTEPHSQFIVIEFRQ
jgi:hypothetical protein